MVRLALEEFGLAFQAIRVDRAKGAQLAPDYLALNPQGLIPVLEDGGMGIFETGAILWHLAMRQDMLGPEGPGLKEEEPRAAVLKWVFFLSNTLHAELRIGFYTDAYIDGAHVEPLRHGLRRRLGQHLDLLEGQLVGGWLGQGRGPTVADIYLAVLLRWAQLYPAEAPPLGQMDRWPGLMALCRRLESRPAIRRGLTAGAIPVDRAFSAPQRPDLPSSEITGRATLPH